MAITASTTADQQYDLRNELTTALKAVERYIQVENPGLLAGTNADVQALVDGSLTDLGFAAGAEPLPSTQAVVTDGDVLTVTGGTVTLSVVDGVVSAEFTPE